MSSVFKPINSGKMRQRVTIERPTLNPDGVGGGVHHWTLVATVWACITSGSSSAGGNVKTFQEEQLRYQQHFNVMIRYGPNITTAMRLRYKDRILWIQSVINVDVLSWEVNLWCREGPHVLPT